MEPTIISCKILPPYLYETKKEAFQEQWQCTVIAEMSDGTRNVVLRYFGDEIQFAANEFIGLNQKQALELFHERDIEYLRSP